MNSVKINEEISQGIKKTCFLPISGPFSNFDGRKVFPGKSNFVPHNFKWFFSTMPKFKKKKQLKMQFQENNQTGERTERRKDRRT